MPSTPPQHNCVKPCHSSPLTMTTAPFDNKSFESKKLTVVGASSLNTLISSQNHTSSGQQIDLNIEAATPTTPKAETTNSSKQLPAHSTTKTLS